MDITWINSLQKNTMNYGQKAYNLRNVLSHDFQVPTGFLLSGDIVSKIAKNTIDKVTKDEISKTFEKLLEQSQYKKIIARSSSTYESLSNAKFSGLFHSQRNIISFQELLNSIKYIYQESFSKNLEEYYCKNNITPKSNHMGIIIQEQINYDIAGVAFITKHLIQLELSFREIHNSIGGSSTPDIIAEILYDLHEEKISYNFRKNDAIISEKNMSIIHEKLREIKKKLLQGFHSILVEFCLKSNSFFILQVNNEYEPLYIQSSLGKLKLSALPDGEALGFKAAAMKYFKAEKLFDKTLFIFPQNRKMKKIKEELQHILLDTQPVTVRYSQFFALGLPRYFAKDIQDAINFIEYSREKSWTTIVHQQLQVKDSFEIFIGHSATVIEHIPGMWESDNQLQPDVIFFSNDKIKYFRYQHNRIAKYTSSKNKQYKECPKCTFATMEEWAKKSIPIIEKLKKKFYEYLPINVHFIEENDGSWSFLNMRNSSEITTNYYEEEKLFDVASYHDLDKWDGITPIHLRLTTKRGREKEIIKIAQKLKGHSSKVFIDFGILSHPAMVLKEYGIELTPAYLLVNTITNVSDYEIRDKKLDIELDPYLRIVKEKQLIINNYYCVVKDKKPICPEHFLIVAKHRVPSIADDPNSKVLPELLKQIEELNPSYNSWVFMERGRASFCSSGFTCSHAHAHYMPTKYFSSTVLYELMQITKTAQFATITEAIYAASQSQGEYFIFGSTKDGFFLELPSKRVKNQKQFIRSFLRKRIRPCIK